ncbi:acyl carrier protein [Azospirillum sp. TSO5]|uniref:acyl carrier protein n=1 Tax=Azospirillum sp. TSO5 TaxID=716760 RepID=UPI000D64A738|nr:acyl carrier protein [Azospirillum sp. TSO5]
MQTDDDRMAVIRQVEAAIRTALFDPDILVDEQTTAADVDGWDSLSHVRIILEIEKRLGISIDGSEASYVKTVGELVDLIGRILSRSGKVIQR